jgi:hypothetical protein
MPPSRTQRHSRAEINIINKAELRANTQDVRAEIRVSRPKNTSLMYGPKQEEFKVGSRALKLLKP